METDWREAVFLGLTASGFLLLSTALESYRRKLEERSRKYPLLDIDPLYLTAEDYEKLNEQRIKFYREELDRMLSSAL